MMDHFYIRFIPNSKFILADLQSAINEPDHACIVLAKELPNFCILDSEDLLLKALQYLQDTSSTELIQAEEYKSFIFKNLFSYTFNGNKALADL